VSEREGHEAAFTNPTTTTATVTTPPPPPPRVVSRLPPTEEWLPLAVEPVCVPAREASLDEVDGPPLLCVVRRTAAMCDLEQRLQLTMVATVGGRRPAVSCEQAAAVLGWSGVPEGMISVHDFAPEDLLVIFESSELRNHVASMPPVQFAGAPLSFRPWNRQRKQRWCP
jgi:hypothetical protein